MTYDPAYIDAVLAAASFRSQRCAIHFHLSAADREDLYQTIVLDALERSSRFDAAKGSAATFTGRLALNAANDFLNELKKCHERFCALDPSDRAPDVIRIPPEQMSPRALQGMIEEFVTRDGTDYGERETELAKKVAQVRSQLQKGQAGIFFYPDDESFEILPKEQFPLAG